MLIGISGQARHRLGGTVPLIGIVPWGVVKNREQLCVEAGSTNYGYRTRKPVAYKIDGQLEPGQAVLDPNHSNFILVSAFDITLDPLDEIPSVYRWTMGPRESLVGSADFVRSLRLVQARKDRKPRGKATG